jgi:hypothetical protein
MLNPFISDFVQIVNRGKGIFLTLAKTDIPANTIIEICATSILTKREAIILSKTIPGIRDKILIDESIIDKEFQLFAELGELELERRLDSGEISPTEFRKILNSKINMNSLLDSKSHFLILGNGILYRISDNPNLVYEYYPADKVCAFRTVKFVSRGSELTYFKQ